MHLETGTRIGGYEIVGLLGAGGMGNVYRARDLRLGREVAIKTLPEHLASDPAVLERFEREARFLASLNHPNIAAIYGLETQENQTFLILELVPGDTLDELLRRGPMPVERVVHVGLEVASALEAAHEAGIVHRDLKPSNIKLTPQGLVKLLDFGVAKHLTPAADATVNSDLTRAGAVVGTPAYMSPEQIVGEDIDRRTDIWAFGCLLFEMLSGKRPFDAGTYIGLADAIRTSDPDWSSLPRQVPEQLRRLIVRCLEKHVRDRLHDIGDARLELRELAGGPRRIPPARRWTRVAAATLGLVGIVAVTAVLARRGGSSPENDLAPRLYQLTTGAGVEEFPAWSPDGRAIAYAGTVGGVRKIFVRRMDSNEDEQVTRGEFDEIHPAWSADGRQLYFVRASEAGRRLEPGDVFGAYEVPADLWALDLGTRAESRRVQNAYYPSLSPDGKLIALDASWAGPRRIWLVDANGANPRQLTSDASEGVRHVQPRWSPDGRRIVFQRIEQTKFDIAVVDVATQRTTAVTDDSYREINPTFGKDARTVYFSSDRGGGVNVWSATLGGDGQPAGPLHQLSTGAGQDVHVAVSRDGQRLSFTTLRQNADLWRMPLGADGMPAGPPEPLVSSTREDSRGAWSPDGHHVAFNSDRGGDMNIWVHDLRSGATRQVTRGAGGDFQPQWSPDGRHLVFFSSRGGSADIWTVELTSGALTQRTRARSIEINPFFSPDGRSIAFQSDSSGRMELWTMPVGGTGRRQLTDMGVYTHFNRWLPDGYIYFRPATGGSTMRVRGTGGAAETVSRFGGAHTSFLPGGQRFVDVMGHKVLWLYGPAESSRQLFTFEDAGVRIDYPVVSPDGRWLLFDRFRPEGGDIWVREGKH